MRIKLLTIPFVPTPTSPIPHRVQVGADNQDREYVLENVTWCTLRGAVAICEPLREALVAFRRWADMTPCILRIEWLGLPVSGLSPRTLLYDLDTLVVSKWVTGGVWDGGLVISLDEVLGNGDRP